MCPGQWGFTFLIEVTVSKLRDVAFVPAGPHKAPCLGVGEGESPSPHSDTQSVFHVVSRCPPTGGCSLVRAGAYLCLSVIISVYLKESVPGLLCCMGHVRKWGVYHDPLTPHPSHR